MIFLNRGLLCFLLCVLGLFGNDAAAVNVINANTLITNVVDTYIVTDPAGNPIIETDAKGNVVSQVRYQPYGEPTQLVGSQPTTGGDSPGFEGKIVDRTTGLSNFGARYYDSKSGRFMSIDPAKAREGDAHGFTHYAFANDNPYRYVDPDGRAIVSVNPNNNGELASMINSLALGTFSFNANNQLQLVNPSGDSTKYSSYYQSRLVQGIKSRDTITVEINTDVLTNSGKLMNVDAAKGGGVTFGYASGGDQRVVISGNSDPNLKDVNGTPLRDNPADILAHELVGHAIPRVAGSDTGNAVANENKVRAQVEDGGQRAAEPWHAE